LIICLAGHFGELDQLNEIYNLIEEEGWRAAKQVFDPSHYSLAQDGEIALQMSRVAIRESLALRHPPQYFFRLLAPFCAHSLLLSQVRATAIDLPPELLGVLAYLDQAETALGYAQLSATDKAYLYIAEGLETRGRFDEAKELRQLVNPGRSNRSLQQFQSQQRETDEQPALALVEASLQTKEFSEAIRTAESIDDEEKRRRALTLVVAALFHEGRTKEAHKSMESIKNFYDKLDVFLSIARQLPQEPFEVDNPDQLALEIAREAEELAHAVSDRYNRAMALVRVAECLLDLGAIEAASQLLDQILGITTEMIEGPPIRASKWLDPPWGVQVLRHLPNLLVRIGEDEKAYDVCKRAILIAMQLGESSFGGVNIPDHIVEYIAVSGQPLLAKKAAIEVLPHGPLGTALWLAADGLLKNDRVEEALAMIDDGRIAPYWQRVLSCFILARAARWLIQQQQPTRAQALCERVLALASHAPTAGLLVTFLAGMASGLKQAGLHEQAQAAADFALRTLPGVVPHQWSVFDKVIDNLTRATSPDQASQLAQWIIRVTEDRKSSLPQNKDDGAPEVWIDLLSLAAAAYAAGVHIDQAIATVNIFGDVYGGRRHLYALGKIAMNVRLPDAGFEAWQKEMQEFANDLVEEGKFYLARDPNSEIGNGLITDSLVSLSRLGSGKQALAEAVHIESPYYRALCLGTIAYDLSASAPSAELADIAQAALDYFYQEESWTSLPFFILNIKTIARCGQVSQAEKAVKKIFALLISAERTKDVLDWRYGSTTKSRLA